MAEPRAIINTYDIELGEKTVSLRLTISSQLALKKKFKSDSLDTIMNAAGDIEKMIAVFNEALNFKDNPNDNLTGEELYDLLVDSGVKGTDAFAEVLFNIANVSGILSDKQAQQVNTGIKKTYDTIFESIEKGKELTDDVPAEHGEEGAERLSFPSE